MLVEVINQQHTALRELFMQHQEALLQGQFAEALIKLQSFHDRLTSHMQVEEQHLFPEFAKIKHKSRWDVDLYAKEHDKINQLYKKIADDLQWLSKQSFNESDTRRNIIALLDKEKTFKGLLEHHEDREESAMLKELDEQLSEPVLQELAASIQSAWENKEIN